MTLAVPLCEPTAVTAGDRLQWQLSVPDVSPADYTLSYALVGPDVLPWNAGWATGFAVDIPSAASASLSAGTYRLTRFLTDTDGNRSSTDLGYITVQANPATMQPGDGQLWAEATLKKVEACIAGQADSGAQQTLVAGRQLLFYSLDELRKLRADLIREVNTLRRQGMARVRLVTFSEPGFGRSGSQTYPGTVAW